MKIDGINPAGKAGEPSKKTEKVSGDSFDTFLKDAMGTGKAASPSAATGPAPVMPATLMFGAAKNPFSAEAVKQLNSTLDDLEMYRATLAAGDVPLKQLLPMAQSLMARKESLVQLMQRVDDPKLKDILSQTAAVILDENSRIHSAA